MNCPNCQTQIPDDGYTFCPACGKRIQGKELDDVISDVSTLGEQVQALSEKLEKKDQSLLEWETSQKIVDRLEKWAKSLAFFAGIPVVLLLVTLSVIAGRSVNNLHDIAESAKSTIQPILDRAKQEANTAKATADAAAQSSSQVQQQINTTKGQVESLSKATQSRATATEQLNTQIARSQKEVDDLHRKVVEQSLAVQQLQNTAKTVKADQNEQKLLEMYPNYGTHYVVGSNGAVIDAKQKKQGSSYISLMLPRGVESAAVMRPKLKGIAAIASDLETEGNRVFIGNIGLNARAGASVAGIMGFSGNICGNIGVITGPCILYTSPQKKDGALALRKRFESIEDIPEAQIRLVDVSKLNADIRELIEISGIDYFVEIKF
jgi:DNA-binding FrmR family transcriptional regulator